MVGKTFAVSDAEATENQRFSRLMYEMRAGSSEAAWELVEMYGPHIRAVVRRMLDARMRAMFDSEDFVQAVWASLIRIQHRIVDVDEPRRFVVLLATLARNKVVDEVRRRKGTQKYNVTGQCSLNASDFCDTPAMADSRATPSEFAIARERWRHLVNRQPEQSRKVLELRLAGATYVEIAETLKINERTARRVIERLLKQQDD